MFFGWLFCFIAEVSAIDVEVIEAIISVIIMRGELSWKRML
jgi:hypothetical protein